MKTCTLAAAFVLAMSQLHVAYGTTMQPLPAIPEEGRLSPVGIYLNILYMNFDLSQPDIAAVGLLVHSKPHYAFSAGSASRPAATTISYPGSKIKSFTLASTYYGCETNPAQVAASVPVAYSITATGYETGSSKPVAIQEFEFSPAAGMTAPLAFGKFAAAFQSLETVTYFQSPAMPTELIMDNVAGTIGT